MYLTTTSTGSPATDLGYLLHKHPAGHKASTCRWVSPRLLPGGEEHRCTAALLLEVDPIGLVRGKRFAGDGFSLSST